jgi:acetyl-CoA synthetase
MEQLDFGGEIVWRPTPAHVENANLTKFMRAHGLRNLDELQKRSTDDIEWFWNAVIKDLGIRFDTPYKKIVDLSKGPQSPKWCVGGRMNIVSSMIERWCEDPTRANRAALIYEAEEGKTRTLTYKDLRREVNKAANALRSLGIGKGDVVGVFMPMTAECVIAMCAIIQVGGIFLPLFSGFASKAISSRLSDADAKALFTCDGFYRRGQLVNMKQTADEAARDVHSLEHVIVHRRAGNECSWFASRDRWWHDVVDSQRDEAETEILDAEDPLMLIYTSGTTGKPKGAVHTHCGFPIKAAQDMSHGLDLHPDEVLYWITDIGWMMGPWLVFGTLILGATMLVYDGAMDHPGPDRLWDIVARHRVTALGISPTLVRALIRYGEDPVRKHDLSSLRKFASTGEPWNPEPWKWLFERVGHSKLPIINYSGGTEISGGIVMGNVLTPMKPCCFSGPLPGMAADVVDEQGNSVRCKVGELIIRKPWIGMTRGFWRDPQRYLDTYWSRFKDIWVHGDFAAIDQDNLWYILGRSDDTIKVAGKRLGPAEIESILVAHPSVSEAAAVGVPDPIKGQSVVCFVVLKPNATGDGNLRDALMKSVINELGKPLAPKELVFVKDLPKTRNAKVMRRVIRAAYLGEDPGDITSLENPAAVEECRRARA